MSVTRYWGPRPICRVRGPGSEAIGKFVVALASATEKNVHVTFHERGVFGEGHQYDLATDGDPEAADRAARTLVDLFPEVHILEHFVDAPGNRPFRCPKCSREHRRGPVQPGSSVYRCLHCGFWGEPAPTEVEGGFINGEFFSRVPSPPAVEPKVARYMCGQCHNAIERFRAKDNAPVHAHLCAECARLCEPAFVAAHYEDLGPPRRAQ
jgi:hypothetical protein